MSEYLNAGTRDESQNVNLFRSDSFFIEVD